MKRVGDLEINQDLDLQERGWRIERFSWVVMLLLIVLALLGLFGTGPLSSASAGDTDSGISARYQRFVRQGGNESITISINPDQVSQGRIELWLSSTFLNQIDIMQIIPQPDEVQSSGSGQTYAFLADSPSGPITVSFSYRPQTVGRLPVEARVAGGPGVEFTQYAYP